MKKQTLPQLNLLPYSNEYIKKSIIENSALSAILTTVTPVFGSIPALFVWMYTSPFARGLTMWQCLVNPSFVIAASSASNYGLVLFITFMATVMTTVALAGIAIGIIGTYNHLSIANDYRKFQKFVDHSKNKLEDKALFAPENNLKEHELNKAFLNQFAVNNFIDKTIIANTKKSPIEVRIKIKEKVIESITQSGILSKERLFAFTLANNYPDKFFKKVAKTEEFREEDNQAYEQSKLYSAINQALNENKITLDDLSTICKKHNITPKILQTTSEYLPRKENEAPVPHTSYTFSVASNSQLTNDLYALLQSKGINIVKPKPFAESFSYGKLENIIKGIITNNNEILR